MIAAWWWIDRWRRSSAYADLTAEEQGMLRNLLDEIWLREDHIIPDDPKSLAQISGDYEAWQRSGDKVLTKMQKVDGGWTNKVALEVISQSERRAENQRNYRERKKQQTDNTGNNATDNGGNNKPDSPSPSPSPSLISVSVSKDVGHVADGPQPASKKSKKKTMSDEEWMATLKANPAYEGLDIDRLYGKMLAWCDTNGKKPTRRRFVNWLNREEPPMKLKGGSSGSTSGGNQKQYTRPEDLA